MHKVFLILVFLSLHASQLYAQGYRDPLQEKKDRPLHCTSPEELADSVFAALKRPLFDSLEQYTPSYHQIKLAYDTFHIEQHDQFVLIKQQYLVHNLNKQFKTMQVKAKRAKINLKFMEKTGVEIQKGVHKNGYPFAVVVLKCARNNKKFQIRFIAMEIAGRWYIADELQLIPIVKEKP